MLNGGAARSSAPVNNQESPLHTSVLYLHPLNSGLIRNEQHPAFCIGNQSMHLEPHTAMQVKQHMADVEDGREVIQVQRVVQARSECLQLMRGLCSC